MILSLTWGEQDWWTPPSPSPHPNPAVLQCPAACHWMEAEGSDSDRATSATHAYTPTHVHNKRVKDKYMLSLSYKCLWSFFSTILAPSVVMLSDWTFTCVIKNSFQYYNSKSKGCGCFLYLFIERKCLRHKIMQLQPMKYVLICFHGRWVSSDSW